MTIRTRSRSEDPISGFGVAAAGNRVDYTNYQQRGTCTDVIGDYGNDHPFDSSQTRSVGGIMNKHFKPPYFNGFPVRYKATEPPLMTVPVISTARVLSASGPITPRVNLPLFVFELKDIPMMLRHAGDLLLKIRRPSGLNPLKEAAASTLAYQFGWGPLLQDLGRLLDFSASVEKTQRNIERANSSKGLKRRISLGEGKTASMSTKPVTSDLSFLWSCQVSLTQSYKQWATVRWRVRDSKQYGKRPTFMEGFRSTYGLNAGSVTIAIWKGLPWTWMIDWFADISNILTSYHNMIHYKPSNMCLMTMQTSTLSFPEQFIAPGDTISAMETTRTRKQRTVVSSPTPTFNLTVPFMDTFKLSVLGSLSILRILGRR